MIRNINIRNDVGGKAAWLVGIQVNYRETTERNFLILLYLEGICGRWIGAVGGLEGDQLTSTSRITLSFSGSSW